MNGLFNKMVKEEPEIRKWIRDSLQNKAELKKKPNSLKALKSLCELIVTNSWYYRTPKNFTSNFKHIPLSMERN
jgi:hypothetical protein